jgi:hypothetical protein
MCRDRDTRAPLPASLIPRPNLSAVTHATAGRNLLPFCLQERDKRTANAVHPAVVDPTARRSRSDPTEFA